MNLMYNRVYAACEAFVLYVYSFPHSLVLEVLMYL